MRVTRFVTLSTAATALVLTAALPASADAAPTGAGSRARTVHSTGEAGVFQSVDRVNLSKCVKIKTNFSGATDHLYITNRCRKARNVKVIVAQHRDFKCQRIKSGWRYTFSWGYPGKIDKVKGHCKLGH
jgi:hypothetical protein